MTAVLKKECWCSWWFSLTYLSAIWECAVSLVFYWCMTLTAVQGLILSLCVFVCVQGSKLQEPCAGRDCRGACPCLPLKGSRVSNEKLCLLMLLFIPLCWPHPIHYTSLLTANLPSELQTPARAILLIHTNWSLTCQVAVWMNINWETYLLDQAFSTLALEVHCPFSFSSNLDQTHLPITF